jgi:hypothetical protein
VLPGVRREQEVFGHRKKGPGEASGGEKTRRWRRGKPRSQGTAPKKSIAAGVWLPRAGEKPLLKSGGRSGAENGSPNFRFPALFRGGGGYRHATFSMFRNKTFRILAKVSRLALSGGAGAHDEISGDWGP